MSDDLAISIRNVSKTFANGKIALQNISFDVKRGEFVVIGGANGSGKTVLMTLIALLDAPTSGEIETESKAGIIFQDANSQILGETVIEDAMFAPLNAGFRKNEARQIAVDSLAKCGLSEKLDAPARFLSGGEKRRLAVAGILAMDCETIIFDEPFANLDWNGVRQVVEILRDLKNANKTVLVLTHETEKCLALADRFIVLYNGNLCYDGTPEDGIKQNLEQWGIKNPLVKYNSLSDLIW